MADGLIAAAMVTHADGYAERDAALLMLAEKQQGRARRITVGADKAYDTKLFDDAVTLNGKTITQCKGDKSRMHLSRPITTRNVIGNVCWVTNQIRHKAISLAGSG